MPTYTRERDFMNAVVSLAKFLGWRVAHFDASVRVVGKERRIVGDKSSAGFPDLVLVRHGRLIFAELKLQKTRTNLNQEEWLDDLRNTSAEVYLWRPADWPEIEAQLR